MLKQLLEKCEDIALNPKKYVCDYIEKSGKKAIGMIPVFGPEELVDAAGMFPVGLWGGYNVKLDLSKQYFPAFCASIVHAIIELGLNGTYNMLSGVVMPGMSDTLISLSQNWRSGVKNIPSIFIVYPQNRKLDCGVEYLVEELEFVKGKLEAIRGSEIKDEEIQESIKLYNEHRALMREFSMLASSHPNTIKNRDRSFVFKSAYFIPKKDHTEMVKQINEELKKLPEEKYDGKKIVVAGLIFDDLNILDILEQNKIRIVGDYLAHESVQYNTDVPEVGKNALERLANQWKNIEGFSAAYEPNKLVGELSIELMKKTKADGAMFAQTKFSDLDEYDMPLFVKDMRDAHLPVLAIEVDQQDANSEQIRTKIQTFAEML
ncbi:2-hydroxyglutaryl-CoA dehydratase, D-component [Peptoanaerobacter stomatis]|uniref:2-hydroxyglutaryl-CoA dehydratase, D-component n=1 Tax=Peptoanaerobacter stomatis TaxID=796937 RepID=J5WHZ4_9FIRM|nr:2-hydroxyacyl-CoA dehydratase family protein [Peptoanaerobacter stomatis]EJU22087.1 2-hydroxyglutaryl-CoA dehydratase, D-component [Peptoanaerobacter stomatis]NWO24864.1 2-hydroxyacyl-CoA dehydratase [Peptostreptococcaceae bacterium oral taxon 081]